MKNESRKVLFWTLLVATIGILVYLIGFHIIPWLYVTSTLAFWLFLLAVLWAFSEFWAWVKVGKRGEMADFAVLALLGIFFFMLTEDFFTALLGAFGVYLFMGIFELKEYAVINKLGLITAITYNFIFVMGLIDTILVKFFPSLVVSANHWRDTAFGFSFWLILILGFAFFGRKYLIVWRFMSPQYLTLGLYLIAWLGVVYVAQFIWQGFYVYIYPVLIITNFIVYFISGRMLGVIMGIKPVRDPELQNIVQEVANELGVKGRIKVGIGQYPIINAMAYGPFFDKRMGIICEDWRAIPRNELQGIIAHELAHLKGNHTLILALITTVDLVIRWIIPLPATVYDYTFNPTWSTRFPMFYFILLNIVIFAFLYIFVRILEGNADRAVRNTGRGEDLARALFNLEGFYAHGRDAGLNTMLLCDEKNLPENQELDYFATAQYISSYLIQPSRASLLSSLLNSHPPSAIRVASMYDHSFSSWTESLMTFSLLRSHRRENFAKGIESARIQFEQQATNQFLRMFQEKSINEFCTRIGLRDEFNLILGKSHLLVHKFNGTCVFGTVQDVKWEENVGTPIMFILKTQNGEIKEVPANAFDTFPAEIGCHYDLRKFGPVTLESVEIAPDQKGADLHFRQNDGTALTLSYKEVKLPTPLDFLDKLPEKLIFLRKHGTLRSYTCRNVNKGTAYRNYSFVMTPRGQEKPETWQAKEIVLFPRHAGFAIHKDKTIWQDQMQILRTLQEFETRITIILKKPVNNLERGKIIAVTGGTGDFGEKIRIENIFQKQKNIPVKDIDYITFSSENIVSVESVQDISYASRLLHKLTKRTHPQRLFGPIIP